MPTTDYQLISEIQAICLKAGFRCTKAKCWRRPARLHELSRAELQGLFGTLERVKLATAVSMIKNGYILMV